MLRINMRKNLHISKLYLSIEFVEYEICMYNNNNNVNQTFNATVSVWDTALDTEADVMRVPANITCSLALMGVEGVELLGTMDVEVTGNITRFEITNLNNLSWPF